MRAERSKEIEGLLENLEPKELVSMMFHCFDDCPEAALAACAESFEMCGHQPPDDWLAFATNGKYCDRDLQVLKDRTRSVSVARRLAWMRTETR